MVKIAVSAKGPELAAAADNRFGRCKYFVIVDSEDIDTIVEVVTNSPGTSGAGPEAVQLLARHGVDVVISGNLGPKAARAIVVAGIKAYQGIGGTVEESLGAFQRNELTVFGG